MNSEALRTLADDISRQGTLDNWQFYVILGNLCKTLTTIPA